MAFRMSTEKSVQNPNGLVIYKCIICDKSWTKKQSLMGHMNAHKDIDWARLSVRLPKEKIDAFKDFCKRHNGTTCKMVAAFVDLALEADKRGIAIWPNGNPVNLCLQQFFNAAPRGKGSYDVLSTARRLGESFSSSLVSVGKKLWPPSCGFADVFLRCNKEVGCKKTKDWISLTDCWSCFLRGKNFEK